ncbi:MAG: glycosyltransferase family 4 protein [Chloroflexi bacterium]|nr:glycosyltransferase family 4 protein [Chloroflexota bacterium]
MKVLLLALDLFGPPGGIARHCRLTLKALTEDVRVQAVDVISLLDDRQSSADPCYFGKRGRSYLGCGGDRRLLIQSVLRALHREVYDVVLAGHVNLAPLLLTAGARPGRSKRVTVIYGVDAWIRLPFIRRLALRRSQRVLSISHYTAQRAVHSNRLDPRRVDVTYSCPDPALTEMQPSPRALSQEERETRMVDTHALLTVSRLWRSEASKGQHAVLRALPRVLESVPSATYWIVGEGDLQPELEELSEELGVKSHVRFFGSVSDHMLRDCYQSCAAYVMPSKWEGFGLTFLEAMARGRPVIGGARDAAPEILGDAALLVDPDNIGQLSQAIVRVLSEPDLQMQLGAAGRQRLADHFTYDHFRTRLMASLQRSLEC